MKIVKDEKKIQRNARIGSITTLVSLAILGGGMYITFTKPDLLYLSLIALLVGFILSQVGIYFTNKWGRKPRPDQMIDKALKGLDDRYWLYHYVSPVSHLLVGPAGIWTLIPKTQRGTITYEKNRWRQRGGGFLQGYLRLFAQEGIGRPDLEIETDIERMEKYFRKNHPEIDPPTIRSALVFFHPDVEINSEEAPHPTLFGKKLKDFIRQTARTDSLSPEVYEELQSTLKS
jgi:hypothetical protein